MLEYKLLNDSDVVAFADYYMAKKFAERKGLKLAEYGDVYGTKLSYCVYNKSGNRNDDEEVIAYYKFDENGKPKAISEEELYKYLFY